MLRETKTRRVEAYTTLTTETTFLVLKRYFSFSVDENSREDYFTVTCFEFSVVLSTGGL